MNTKEIPRTDSIEELARFWESHDLTDFADELEDDFEEDKVLRSLLNTENPEIALSALELLGQAREDYLKKAFTGKETEKIQEASDRLQPRALWNASGARLGLLRCLNDFFLLKRIQEATHPEEREYLKLFFKQLRTGDTVMTLNWDSTAERTLGELALWNPSDGYGISKNLKYNPQPLGNDYSLWEPGDLNATLVWEPRVERDEECSLPPSRVRVLKLHGSVGWMRQRGSVDGIFFDQDFLRYLFRVQLKERESPSTLCDPDFDIHTHTEPVMVVPTFLKSVPEGAEMQRIWHLADEALAKADVVEVVGYSLPPSDSAMHALLNRLRFRTEARHVHIHVYDPNEETRKRWNDFIGADVSTDAKLE